MTTKILTSDILVADVIVKIADLAPDKLKELREKFGLEPNGKAPLTKEQFDDMSNILSGVRMQPMPGGSSANTITTINRFLGPTEAEATFVGVAGEGMFSQMIKGDLKDARVKLLPEKKPENAPHPGPAVSYCFVDEKGTRSLFTYPGNAKDILQKDMISPELIEKHDAVLVQGSLWQKMGWEYSDSFMKHRWDKNKELYLCLPTHADFGGEHADFFQYLIPSANLLLSNDDELARTAKTMTIEQEKGWKKAIEKGGNSAQEAQAALDQARQEAREKVLATFKNNDVLSSKEGMPKKQVAFITRGMEGTSIITKDGIIDVPNPPFDEKDKVNNLGSGDTTFAGIIAGHLKGMSNEDCARLGMYMAREKLLVDAARIPKPREALAIRLHNTANGTDKYVNLAGVDKATEMAFAKRTVETIYPTQQEYDKTWGLRVQAVESTTPPTVTM